MNSPLSTPPVLRRFYDRVYEKGSEPDAAYYEGREEWERAVVEAFIAAHCGPGRRTLEVGCGHAPYQHRIPEYVGLDITPNCAAYVQKPFVTASAVALPFADASFDALISLHTLEHVHEPALAIAEILRVLRPGAAALLLPSWYVRSWANEGLRVRPYSELRPVQRLRKFLLPLTDAAPVRALGVFPRRVVYLAAFAVSRAPVPFRFRRVTPNYDAFIDSDSDACNWIDPFDVMLFSLSRGCVIEARGTWLQRFLFRTGPLVIVKG